MQRKRKSSTNILVKEKKGPEASLFELIERSTRIRFWVVMSSWSYVPCDTPQEARRRWRNQNGKAWKQKHNIF